MLDSTGRSYFDSEGILKLKPEGEDSLPRIIEKAHNDAMNAQKLTVELMRQEKELRALHVHFLKAEQERKNP